MFISKLLKWITYKYCMKLPPGCVYGVYMKHNSLYIHKYLKIQDLWSYARQTRKPQPMPMKQYRSAGHTTVLLSNEITRSPTLLKEIFIIVISWLGFCQLNTN